MIGKTISHYRVVEKIGQGGMGVVYRAEDTRLGREVALKFLEAGGGADEAKRFQREARAVSAMSHPNVSVVHDVGEHEDKQFIVFEYLHGGTLTAKIATYHRSGREIPEQTIIAYATQMARGLAHAHRNGVIHRDLKPDNVMFNTEGALKITDFGLATQSGETRITHSGAAMGTLAYMPPEQVRGEEVDARADLFSLGVMLYELATGQLPFRGEHDGTVVYKILNETPPPPSLIRSSLSSGLETAILRCMEKDPEKRYAGADEVVEALEGLGRGTAPGASGSDQEVSLAVLPFVNGSADPEHEYLSEGITDTLIDNLSQLPKLRVIARATVFRYGNKDVDPVEAGKAIGVGAVLTGHLRPRGEEIVIRAELVDVADGSRVWGKQYRRPMTDLLEVEEEISREITNGLRIRLAPEEKDFARPRTENPEAYQQYLKGRHVWNRWKTPEGMRTAIAFFEKALEIDPLYALAFAGLADSHNMLGNVKAVPPGEAYPTAKTAAMQGLAIDDGVAELHASLGFIQRFWEWDWPAAESSFSRAIELKPGYATAYRFYGQLLVSLGRFDEAIETGEKGLALDPLSPILRGAVGDLYFYARRYDTAIEYYRFTIDQDPEFLAGHTDIARAYELVGRYNDAIEAFETAAALAPKGPPEPSSGLAHVYARMGEREKALEILGQLLELRERKYVSPYGIASIHACLGDVDKSLDWLETAYDEHDQTLVWLRVHPRLDPVREQPRYHKLLQKMNL